MDQGWRYETRDVIDAYIINRKKQGLPEAVW